MNEIKNIIKLKEKINAKSRSIKHQQTLVELDSWNEKDSNKNLNLEKFQKFKNENLEVINLQKKLIQSQLINFLLKIEIEQQSKKIIGNKKIIKTLSNFLYPF